MNRSCCVQVITEHKEKRSEGMPVVVDPVLVSTSGSSLSEDSAVAAMKAALLPVATVLTPNLTEASTLLGVHPGCSHGWCLLLCLCHQRFDVWWSSFFDEKLVCFSSTVFLS